MVNLYQYKDTITKMKFIFHTGSLHTICLRSNVLNGKEQRTVILLLGTYFVHAEQCVVEVGTPTHKRNDVCTYICM